jgi:steroid 5-alpha reductase family enzyme
MTTIESMMLILAFSAITLLIYVFIAFIVGTVKKNNGIMDIFYGPAYFVVSFTSLISSYLLFGPLNFRQILTTLLVFIWSMRLASYIYVRNKGKPEDPRYKVMRDRWGTNVIIKSLFKIYLFQAIIIFLVDIPSWMINISYNPSLNSLLDFFGITLWVGSLIWLMGFLFETIGDWSLYFFLKKLENKGKVMDKNVWKYTQHPNYFGEVTQWYGLAIIALAVPWGLISFIGPVYLTFQIIKVSGVRLLDKRFERDDAYADYKRRTSSFFPWFPKKNTK